MATIVPFVIPRRATMTPRPAREATIIIFPGVRYEHAEPPVETTPPSVASGGARRGRKNKAQ